MIQIRPATAKDATDICAIWNPIILDTTFTFTDVLKTPSSIGEQIGSGVWLVVQDGSDVIGFGHVAPFRPGPGYRETGELSLYLSADRQGAGVGAALLSALEGAARDAGYYSLIAATAGHNERANRFFSRQGYVQVAHIPKAGVKAGARHDLTLLQKFLQT